MSRASQMRDRRRAREIRAAVTRWLETVDRMVTDTGWMVQGVLATDTEPGWAYTIGFGPTLGHPELMIACLPPQAAQQILNDIGERIRGGERFDPGGTYTNLMRVSGGGVVPAYVTAIPDVVYPEWFGAGQRYYRDRQLGDPVWHQVVWPDPQGRLPWDDGFDELYGIQPLLGPTP